MGIAMQERDRLHDEGLRDLWREAGGEFHGPNVETGTMPESKLLPLLRRFAAAEQELRNIAEARRFDRKKFDDDSSFADWAQSRARHTLATAK